MSNQQIQQKRVLHFFHNRPCRKQNLSYSLAYFGEYIPPPLGGNVSTEKYILPGSAWNTSAFFMLHNVKESSSVKAEMVCENSWHYCPHDVCLRVDDISTYHL